MSLTNITFITCNSHQLLEAYYAVPFVAGLLNPINFRLNHLEIEYILNHAETNVMIFHQDFLRLVDALRKDLSAIKRCIIARELGAIAISLVQSGEFANAHGFSTGSTAHLPPVYPLLISLIYRRFGLTPAAGYVSMLLIAITASVLYALLPWIADQFGLSKRRDSWEDWLPP